MTSCTFCDEFQGGVRNDFYNLYGGSPRQRVIFETARFVVVPSIGQLVEGYLLILPKKHFLSLGRMPVEWFLDLENLNLEIRELLRKTYCEPFLAIYIRSRTRARTRMKP